MNNRRCPKRVPVVKIKPQETQEKSLENKPLKEIQNAPENPLLGVTTSEPLIRTINFEFNKKKKEKVSYYYGLPVTSIAIILPFTYNLNIFMHPSVFLKAYPLVMLMTAILFVLNIKIKKPTGIWYVICSILAVIEIAIISAAMR